MDHKGSISLLISFLGINRLFTWVAIHTQQQKPHRDQLNNFAWFLQEIGQKSRARLIMVIYFILQYPLPKNLRAPTNATSTLSLRWNKLHTHHLKIPKVITHELPHNHSRNPWHDHHLPCVGPYKKTY
jgi:hypothetical protein